MEQNGEPRVHPHVYSQMPFYKDAKTIQWEKDRLFKIMLGKPSIHMQKNEVGPLLYAIYKN